MDKDLVSILIPAYNRATLIAETLDSVAAQTYQNWECIIVDDGSTDATIAIVTGFVNADSRFKCFSRPANLPKGANACRNYAFEFARGLYVNWFDSDDLMQPDFIEAKVAAFEMYPGMDAVISKKSTFTHDPNEIVSYEHRTLMTNDIISDFFNLKVTWYLPDVMWVKSYLENKDLFDQLLLAGQDRDFHCRMLLHQPKIQIIDRFLTNCRSHPDNITSRVNNIKSNLLKVSHLYGTVKLMHLLADNKKLSTEIKLYYFKMTMKYLPFVVNSTKDTNTLFKLLKFLSVPHFDVFWGWFKVSVAYVSLKLTGRGHVFLK